MLGLISYNNKYNNTYKDMSNDFNEENANVCFLEMYKKKYINNNSQIQSKNRRNRGKVDTAKTHILDL